MKKGLEYAGNVLFGLAVIVLVCVAVGWVAGIRPAVVTSGSMEPAIKTGSLILINENDKDVRKGDVIAFRSGVLRVAHRIIAVTEDGYITKGDNNDNPDQAAVKDDMIDGTVIASIPAVGYAMKWMARAMGISAYFNSSDYTDNTVTVGHNAISVMEEFIPPDRLEPGVVIPKKVNVENTGETPCAVRVSAEFSDSDMKELTELDIDGDYWELRDDGYYYYREILEVGDITHTLFSTVTVSESADAPQLKGFELMIHAESIGAEPDDDYRKIVW